MRIGVGLSLVALVLVGFAAVAPAAGDAAGPSFDCGKATRPLDRLICGNPDLARADGLLARAYQAGLAGLALEPERIALRDAQRAWLARRDALCGAAGPADTAIACLQNAYAQRLAELDGQKAPPAAAPVTSILADAALTAAHPAEREEMGFPDGTFSPSGALFAFAVSNIATGDSDQVWLYRLGDRQLVAATATPVQGQYAVDIEGMRWAGEVLYVFGQRGEYAGVRAPFKLAVTMAGARDVAVPPDPAPAPGAALDTTAEAGDTLSSQGDRRVEDDRYQVISKNHGHGALTLSVRAKGGKRDETIATGSWSLASFVFDAPRQRVLYPNGVTGIDVYDLKTRRILVTLPGPSAALLDVARDGQLAAYTGQGACDGPTPPGDPGRRKVICFVTLP